MSEYGDAFGDRMKQYEAAETSRVLNRDVPIYARIDGRSFSRFTRNMERPFDRFMCDAMVNTTKILVEETNALIGYTQSDEISLVWLCDRPESQPLFGGKVQKLTSVLAGLASSAFMFQMAPDLAARLPHFDCRVFSLPSKEEAANAVLWRTLDARKNAVSSACRSMYGPKQMHLKDQTAMRAMMLEKGVEFEDYPADFKWGTFVRRRVVQRVMTPEEMERIPEKHRPAPDTLVTRSHVEVVPMGEFWRVRNRAAVIFDGAAPL